MRTEEATFFSDGLRLGATYYWPDSHSDSSPAPLVIANSGFTGLRHIHPARFARSLTARDLPCFAFDYRGFADSEGPRHRVLLEEQVRDIMHGTAFAASDDRIDASRIILLGWGMGGGLIIDAARELETVCGLIAINGFYNGDRVQHAHRDANAYSAFRTRVEDERSKRSRTGGAEYVDPFDIYPLDEQSRTYVDEILRTTPGYQAETYSMELADSLLRWNVEAYATSMQLPLLIAHGDSNLLHPTLEAKSLYDAYAGPKELYWIKEAGHTEFMHDADPRFQALAAHVGSWIDNLLTLEAA